MGFYSRRQRLLDRARWLSDREAEETSRLSLVPLQDESKSEPAKRSGGDEE